MPTILLIEDEAAVKMITSTTLRKKGFEVVEAASAMEGLQLSRICNADLIISDVHMPQMNGFALLEAVRAKPATASTPVILLTGNPDQEGWQRAKELGASEYLAKPISAADLIRAINSHIRKQQVA